MNKVLVTGGAGYLGSHVCLRLLELGHEPIIFDRDQDRVLDVYTKLLSLYPNGKVHCFPGNITRRVDVDDVFDTHNPEAVVHLAGIKPSQEHDNKPLAYYRVNTHGTMILLDAMLHYDVNSLVYGSTMNTTSAGDYRKSKHYAEQLINAAWETSNMQRTILRFGLIGGADPVNLFGDNCGDGGYQSFLMLLCKAAAKEIGYETLYIYKTSEKTPDNSPVRTYVDAVTAARVIVDAVDNNMKPHPYRTRSVCSPDMTISALKLVELFEKVNGVELNNIVMLKESGKYPLVPSISTNEKDNNSVLPYGHMTLAEICKSTYNYYLENKQGTQ